MTDSLSGLIKPRQYQNATKIMIGGGEVMSPLTRVKVKVMLRPTVSRPVSWNKAPILGLRPDFNYCQTVSDLLIWGALSDERISLSFAIVAGPRQRSYSRVRVPWNSRPHFTVSDSRLPVLSPPTTRRTTVEVLDPASIWDCSVSWLRVRVTLRLVVRLSDKPLETHGQKFYFPTKHLRL
jgi:hypothetical protein